MLLMLMSLEKYHKEEEKVKGEKERSSGSIRARLSPLWRVAREKSGHGFTRLSFPTTATRTRARRKVVKVFTRLFPRKPAV